MAELFAPTLAEQIACVEREIRKREYVYPRAVAQGAMNQHKAGCELEMMRAVLGTLQALAEKR